MEAAAQSQLKGTHPGAGRWRLAASTVLALGAGFALRAWMLSKFFQANGDTLVYGGIAKNLLLHGRYALTLESGETFSTLIRLPGYPLFLAACFRLFGMENYGAVAWVQIALELIGCVLLADFARRIAPARYRTAAAQGTLWLAALCPFTAVYAATPLAEGPTLFVLALALWAAARFTEKPGWGCSALVHVCGDVRCIVAAGRRACGGGAGTGVAGRSAKRSEGGGCAVGKDGGGVRTAGADAVRDMDMAQLAGVSRGATAGSGVGNRSGRPDDTGVGPLGEDVEPGFCFDIRGVLECAGR